MKIAVHSILKNEDIFLWYAVSSVAEYVDEILLWDTGSIDNTPQIIRELMDKYPSKIKHEVHSLRNSTEVTNLRQQMLSKNNADWIILLDGDEVWWREEIIRLTRFIRKNGEKYDSCVVHYKNLVGDMYHYQDPKLGGYNIDNKKGFLTIRAFNAKIKGLEYKKDYPLEGLFNHEGTILQELDPVRRRHLEGLSYLHMTHLERSSKVKNKKNKYQDGIALPSDYFYPEVFFEAHPDIIPSVWKKMTNEYLIKAKMLAKVRKLINIYGR